VIANDCSSVAEQKLQSGVYVVATPIGNMADLSPRAIKTLALVDIVYAEDTRQTQKLLQYLELRKTVYPLHQHNEAIQKVDIGRQLAQGKTVAIVSDAGTPMIADPGAKTLAFLREQGNAIFTIPGCCAVIAALSISGLPGDRFQFAGFMPSKAQQRRAFLTSYQYCEQTTVFFETPHRIRACLQDFADIFASDRLLSIARELTKQFEESAMLTVGQAPQWLRANDKRCKGEFVLVLGGSDKKPPGDWQRLAKLMLAQGLSVKSITQVIAAYSGEHKKRIYQFVLTLSAHQ